MARDGYKHFVKVPALTAAQCKQVLKDVPAHGPWGTWKEAYSEPTETSGGMSSEYIDLDDGFDWLHDHMNSWAWTNNVWGFDTAGWHQPLRVSHYQSGDYHDWHIDHTDSDRSKLAFSVLLNPTSEFDGGQAQFMDSRIPSVQRGQGVLFPAYHPHRVTPVTRGERFVLLGWMTGPRYR